ncbi:MAG TPA: response regulator transcription factor [Flavobacteriales bacterium]|nr:response regulator transcription factor [Flavobacteriales bacterium]
MENKKINVVIADDHQMFIDGLKSALTGHEKISITATANTGNQLMAVLEQKPADVILLDINMPEMNGIEAARQIVKKFPALQIIVLSMYLEKEFIEILMKTGISGYILKNTGINELELAIVTVASGKKYFSHDVALKMVGAEVNVDYAADLTASSQKMVELTDREKDVLKLIAKEFTTPEIAEKLFISAYTVETHRKNLIRKLGVKNIAGLVKYAVQHGFAD